MPTSNHKRFSLESVSLTAFLPADGPVLDALLVGSSPSKLTGNKASPSFLTQNSFFFNVLFDQNFTYQKY